MHDFKLIVEENHAGQRLDKVLPVLCETLSRTRLKTLILDGHVKINAQTVRVPKHLLMKGDIIDITIPPLEEAIPQPENIPLDIVYEDEDIIVINKPVGLVVHPGAGHWTGTLVNALLFHCAGKLSGINGIIRPGIVHRLDKDTSGLMVVAKHDQAHQGLVAQFHTKTLKRAYVAFVFGCPQPLEGKIETQIGRSPRHRQKMAVLPQGGKEAITHYRVEQVYGPKGALPFASRVHCNLETGRTHQIRVHLSHLGHALIGDPLYGRASQHEKILQRLMREADERGWEDKRQALHAYQLTFIHPVQQKEMRFEAILPDDLRALEAMLEEGFETP